MKHTSWKHFLILWSSQSISILGSSLTRYALILWVYQQQGSVSSIAWLSICTYLPSILFCFMAGTLTDRMNKKVIMLCADGVAALATLIIALLYACGNLVIWHLYIINIVLSLMDALQSPATMVATSLLIPKQQYARASSLQSFSNSLTTIVTPSIAMALLSFTNLTTIFCIDLVSFLVAFFTLLRIVSIPEITRQQHKDEPFLIQCATGFKFLKQHKALLHLILFFSFINLLASMSDQSLLPALILSRTNNNTEILALVTSSIGIGALTGSILSALSKDFKHKTMIIFFACAMSFLCFGLPLTLSNNYYVWIVGSILANLPLPFLNANLTTILRLSIPIEMQGRVFSTRDTLQFITIPLGLALGGYLSDVIFEPIMSYTNPISNVLSTLVGSGKESGIAVIFLITSLIGSITSIAALTSKRIRSLDKS